MGSSFGKMNGDDSASSRFDDIASAMAVVVIALAGIITIAALLLPADPGAITPALALDYLPFDSAVRPEPTERSIFIGAALLLPFLALIAVHRGTAGARGRLRQALHVLAIGIAVLLVAAIGNAPGTRRVFRIDQPWTLLLASMATVAITALAMRRGAGMAARSLHPRRAAWLAAAASASLAMICVMWRPLPLPALRSSFRHYANLDAVLAPVVQATHGTPPLTGYTSQYGLYAEALAPWFDAIGLSVATFTMSMAALQLFALGALFMVLVHESRSRLIALAGCAAVAFVAGGYVPMRFDPDPYFQYWPVRFLWPALMVPLVWRWSRAPGTAWLALTSCAGAIAIFWNIDSGLAAAGAWLGLLFFRALAAARTSSWRRELRTFALALGVMLAAGTLLALWLRWRAGAHVDFAVLVDAHRRFYLTGFFMRPLPLQLHAWQFVAAACAGGVVIGMAHALGRIRDPRAILVHFLSYLGIGLFAYYQGRSVDQALVAASWPAVLVVMLCADWALALQREARLDRPAARVLVTSAIAFGVFCAALLLRDTPGIIRMTIAQWRARPPTVVTQNVAFIREYVQPGIPAPVIARFQAVYAAGTGEGLALPGHPVAESVSRSQGLSHVRHLEQSRPAQLFIGVPYLEEGPRNPYVDVLALLARDYELRAETVGLETLRLYVRRR